MRNIVYLCTVVFFLSGSFASAQLQNADMAKTPISSWKAVGTRWAEALDTSGNTLGIYDLSFPVFIGPIPVGQILRQDVTLSQFIGATKVQLANDSSSDAQNALNQLNSISDSELQQGTLAANWWKSVPWKSATMVQSVGAPQSFKLSDIDYSGITGDYSVFSGLIQQAENAAEDSGGYPVLGSNLLDQFQFQQQSDGSYLIFWTPNSLVDHPQKLVDFQSSKSQMYINIAWESAHLAVNSALGMISVPGVAALVGTAIDTVFYFHDLLQMSHQEMLAEMIYAAQENAPAFSPMGGYSASKLGLSEVGLFFSEQDLETFTNWFLKDAQTEWNKDFATVATSATAASQWVSQNRLNIQTLNPRFLISSDQTGAKQIEVLPLRANKKTQEPSVGVDYANYQAVAKARELSQIEYTLVDFASRLIPTPVVDTVILWVYNYLIDNPIKMEKYWEARLEGHLEQRQATGEESWSNEINIIEGQRINPFELTEAQSNALVAKRKQDLQIAP